MRLEAIWQVEGTLVTRTAMHVGDGGTRVLEGNSDVEVQTVAKAADGRARIPGASLKGVVRSGFEEGAASGIFGKKDEDGKNIVGGSAQFLDAYSAGPVKLEVLCRTAIDAVSGTAKQHFLFQMEVVPAGTLFAVRIRGKCFGEETWQAAVSHIETGLRRFNQDTIRMGAGEANQKGLCSWTLGAVRVMDSESRRQWLKSPAPLDGYLETLPDRKAEVETFGEEARESKALSVTLRFDDHPFLVNDPRKTGKKEDDKHAHAARRTADGRLLLPAESFRGVLAHQAARIARTRFPKGGGDKPASVKKDSGGGVPQGLNELTRLFGAAGWSSVLKVSDFVEAPPTGEINSKVQQFLAVDRFTGGGVEKRKFDAEGGWAPRLQGKVTVDLKRLEKTGKVEPALGLLALTLRDLAEGDLSFGWGSSKGYGWATIETGGVRETTWLEQAMDGWAEGSVKDWVSAWEKEGVQRG